ncbi:MAG: GNAT family N-acetyltransferase [Calothrix sp. MO_167.B12]|nr:GNAT family N-acetyltransferase [Calothrix sp. MO_167.B12]
MEVKIQNPMSKIEIRPVKDQTELDDMLYQRWLVLRAPLGMAKGTETDRYENSAFHLVAVCNHQVIGSARLHLLSPELGHISYVSVLEEFRNQGIGTKLMEKLMEIAEEKQYKTLQLKARIQYLNFYQRLKFVEEGEPFDYLGIPHMFMRYRV